MATSASSSLCSTTGTTDETSSTSEIADSTNDQQSSDSSDSDIESDTTEDSDSGSCYGSGTSSDCWTSDSSDMDENEDSREVGEKSNYLTSPLYDGANIRVVDSYLLLFQFSLRHSLSGVGFEDLIKLVSVHLPSTSNCTGLSTHTLEKYFAEQLKIKPQLKLYCDHCLRLFEDEGKCPSDCDHGMKRFIYVPIANQLKNKLEDPTIWNALQRRFTSTIYDIYDGVEYKKHSAFLRQPANVSLLINTDGVRIFKSSKYELWPVWMIINELPPSLRFSKQNMLLCGLWFDMVKPQMSTYLYSLISELEDLYTNGIQVSTPDGQMTCRAALLLISVDLPAQSKVLNMKQYNGSYACNHCEDEGVPRPSSHLHRNWPYCPTSIIRTHSSMIENAKDTLRNNKPVKGIKGASVVCIHRPFDISKGIAIDDLHVLFLGTVNDLLNYWFSERFRTKPFSIYRKIRECDMKLLSIKVPDTISRLPRSIQDFKHWKGSQLRSWLLYYSVPVLSGVLPEPYFSHFCYLVAATHIVLGDGIEQSDIETANIFFETFCSELSIHYGPNSCTMKMHLLRHIPKCCRDWGPLWAYSCFPFETMNHHIKKLFHGSRNMSLKLALNHSIMQGLPALISLRRSTEPSHAYNLMDKMSGKNKSHVSVDLGDCISLGQLQQRIMSDSELQQLNSKLPSSLQYSTTQGVPTSTRILKDHSVFFSQSYTRVKARNSYTVECTNRLLGQIRYFAHVSQCHTTYAVLTSLVPITSSTLQQHFRTSNDALDKLTSIQKRSGILLVEKGPVACVPVSLLLRKCVYMYIDDCEYVAMFPNNCFYD